MYMKIHVEDLMIIIIIKKKKDKVIRIAASQYEHWGVGLL